MSEKTSYRAVAKLDELTESEGKCVVVDDVKIALFKSEEGEVYAIGDVCPHQSAPLSDGWFESEDLLVTCPLHAWDFDVRTGARTAGPESVTAYAVRINGDTIEVAV